MILVIYYYIFLCVHEVTPSQPTDEAPPRREKIPSPYPSDRNGSAECDCFPSELESSQCHMVHPGEEGDEQLATVELSLEFKNWDINMSKQFARDFWGNFG